MRKLLLTALLSVLTISANAEDPKWHQIIIYEEGGIYFMPSSYTEDTLGFRAMWMRVDFTKPEDDIYRSDVLLRADCPARKLGPTQIISYGKNGKVIEKNEVPEYLSPIKTVPPNGLEYYMLETMCNRS